MLQRGRAQEAADELETALQIRPNYAEADSKLGEALTLLPGGREALEEALAQIRAALRLESGTKWAEVIDRLRLMRWDRFGNRDRRA
jgi:cytochrome c-type biogenesis protein CcmH/NrfG